MERDHNIFIFLGEILVNMNTLRIMMTWRQAIFFPSGFECPCAFIEDVLFMPACLQQNHFRHDHFLCEDEACLVKKFIVFQSESEIKVILLT